MRPLPCRPFRVLPLALALVAPACSSTSTVYYEPSGLLVGERAGENGTRVEYRLYPGQGSGEARIDKTVTTPYERPALEGVTWNDLDAARAASVGVEAWSGIHVGAVAASSAAAKAGLTKNDVVVSAFGEPVTNARQFTERFAARAAVGAALPLRVRRDGAEIELRILPDVVRGKETHTEAIPLDTSKGVQSLTGMQAATVPAELAKEVFDRPAPFVLVTGVLNGSPAYLEGVRRGDRLIEAEGASEPTLAAVRRAVYARSGGPPHGADAQDSLEGMDVGEASGDVPVRVDGPLGPHSAELAVDPELLGDFEFHFPIVYSYTADVDSLSWSFLDFIFQFGATYRRTYLPSATREPRVESKLSMLPFGMFEFERQPTSRRTRLFWFIEWESTR